MYSIQPGPHCSREGVEVASYIREGRYFRELLAAIFLTILSRSLYFLGGGGRDWYFRKSPE